MSRRKEPVIPAELLGFVLGSLPFLWPNTLPSALGGQENNR